MFKKGDFAVIAIILALAVLLFSALIVFSKGGKTVRVTVSGKVTGNYPLNQNAKIKIKTKNGTNILVIKNGEAWFESSDCPDKTCEKTGAINKSGQTIVCLPHKVVAEVLK